MIYLKIADIVFLLDYCKYENIDKDMFIQTYLYRYLSDYICEPRDTNYVVEFSRDKEYTEKGEFVSSGWYNRVYKFEDTIIYAFYHPGKGNLGNSFYYTYSVEVSDNWHTAKITDYLTNEVRFSKTPYLSLSMGLHSFVAGALLRNNSFFIHGVSVQYKGKGLVFSAAAGVGKTTHTSFWQENFGAEILNGDTPIIKLVDGKPFIYGSPWCGTSNITVNKVVPLDAVVVISRGSENKIRKLNTLESVGYLLPHMKRLPWDEESVRSCLDYCEALINTVSIYGLECRPDSDSAEVARRGILELNED